MRTKLIVLASLQHQIISRASGPGVGPHGRLLTRWEEPTVPCDHFASPAAALESSDLQSPGPDILIRAARPGSCLTHSRLDLQRLFLAAPMVNQAQSFPLCLYQQGPALRHLTQALVFLSLNQGFPHLHGLASFVEGQKKCFLPPSESQKVPVPSEPRPRLGAPAHRGCSAASHRLISGSRPHPRPHPMHARMEQSRGRQAKGCSRSRAMLQSF